jgi:beta-galactosidase
MFLGSSEGRAAATAYMTELIAQHGNHTCICLWSVGNEFQSFRTSVADYVRHVARATKTADPTRLTTFCSYFYTWDKAYDYVDVISVNEYFGWHLASLNLLAGMLDRIHEEWPHKPVLISEFGVQSEHGMRNHSPKLAGPIKSLLTKDLSEDHQSLFLRSHLDTIWSRDHYIAGTVVWTYNDFMAYSRKPKTPETPVGQNSCGLVTMDRRRKLAWETVGVRYGRLAREAR